jgi:hypothetical protein
MWSSDCEMGEGQNEALLAAGMDDMCISDDLDPSLDCGTQFARRLPDTKHKMRGHTSSVNPCRIPVLREPETQSSPASGTCKRYC